jgi:hypothetical protein
MVGPHRAVHDEAGVEANPALLGDVGIVVADADQVAQRVADAVRVGVFEEFGPQLQE